MSTYPLASDYLEQFGISPSSVVEDGFDEEGYDMLLTVKGNRVVVDNEYARVRLTWPEGFDYEEFISLVWRDQGAVI